MPGEDVKGPRAIAFANIEEDSDLDFAMGAKRSPCYFIQINFDTGKLPKTYNERGALF
jgi:hypothetical protein